MSTFKAPKGTYDLIPPQSATYLAVREAIAAPLKNSGYGYIETPGFENVELFARGVGESTDIVTKEMYAFETKGGDQLALRPEGTASVLRAALEANLHKAGNLPVKLWYSGSYYRYERPQKGRYRHFSQVGAEAIGAEDPALDAELIILADQAYRSLGLRNFRILLNSLGDKECRPVYRAALQDFLRGWTWTRTPGAGSTSTRCASWTTSVRAYRSSSTGRPSSATTSARHARRTTSRCVSC